MKVKRSRQRANSIVVRNEWDNESRVAGDG
jgi:hypothetical protein